MRAPTEKPDARRTLPLALVLAALGLIAVAIGLGAGDFAETVQNGSST